MMIYPSFMLATELLLTVTDYHAFSQSRAHHWAGNESIKKIFLSSSSELSQYVPCKLVANPHAHDDTTHI